MSRQTILLNEHGDTVIKWDESNDAKMRQVIEKKMREGMTFFIVEPIFGVFRKKKKTEDVDSIMNKREFHLKDADFNSLILDGTAETINRPMTPEIETKGIASTVDQVINNTTIAVTQRRGG